MESPGTAPPESKLREQEEEEKGTSNPKEPVAREDSIEVPTERVGDDRPLAEHEHAAPRRTGSSDSNDDDDDSNLNLPPGRMHATRVPERLSGSQGDLAIPPRLATILQHHQRKRMDGGPRGDRSPRTRSRSPSLKDGRTGTASSSAAGPGGTSATTVTADANSSISSLEEFVDQDILYDRAGFTELDSDKVQSKLHSSREFANLPPVSERMSEETMDDVHAFSDVVRSSNASRANSTQTGNEHALEPLNEIDEDDLDQISEEGDGYHGDGMMMNNGCPTQVIVTNLDNLSISNDEDDPSDAARGTRGTGGTSSLLDESPSAPTA